MEKVTPQKVESGEARLKQKEIDELRHNLSNLSLEELQLIKDMAVNLAPAAQVQQKSPRASPDLSRNSPIQTQGRQTGNGQYGPASSGNNSKLSKFKLEGQNPGLFSTSQRAGIAASRQPSDLEKKRVNSSVRRAINDSQLAAASPRGGPSPLGSLSIPNTEIPPSSVLPEKKNSKFLEEVLKEKNGDLSSILGTSSGQVTIPKSQNEMEKYLKIDPNLIINPHQIQFDLKKGQLDRPSSKGSRESNDSMSKKYLKIDLQAVLCNNGEISNASMNRLQRPAYPESSTENAASGEITTVHEQAVMKKVIKNPLDLTMYISHRNQTQLDKLQKLEQIDKIPIELNRTSKAGNQQKFSPTNALINSIAFQQQLFQPLKIESLVQKRHFRGKAMQHLKVTQDMARQSSHGHATASIYMRDAQNTGSAYIRDVNNNTASSYRQVEKSNIIQEDTIKDTTKENQVSRIQSDALSQTHWMKSNVQAHRNSPNIHAQPWGRGPRNSDLISAKGANNEDLSFIDESLSKINKKKSQHSSVLHQSQNKNSDTASPDGPREMNPNFVDLVKKVSPNEEPGIKLKLKQTQNADLIQIESSNQNNDSELDNFNIRKIMLPKTPNYASHLSQYSNKPQESKTANAKQKFTPHVFGKGRTRQKSQVQKFRRPLPEQIQTEFKKTVEITKPTHRRNQHLAIVDKGQVNLESQGSRTPTSKSPTNRKALSSVYAETSRASKGSHDSMEEVNSHDIQATGSMLNSSKMIRVSNARDSGLKREDLNPHKIRSMEQHEADLSESASAGDSPMDDYSNIANVVLSASNKRKSGLTHISNISKEQSILQSIKKFQQVEMEQQVAKKNRQASPITPQALSFITNLNPPIQSPSQKGSPIYIRSEVESQHKKVRFEEKEESSPGESQTKGMFQPMVSIPALGIGKPGAFPQPQISFRHRSSNSQLTEDENNYFRSLLNPVGISDVNNGSPRYIEIANKANKERINEVLNDIGLQLKLERQLDSLKTKMNEFIVTDSMKKIPKNEDSGGKKVSVVQKGQFSLNEGAEATEQLPMYTSEVSSRTKEPLMSLTEAPHHTTQLTQESAIRNEPSFSPLNQTGGTQIFKDIHELNQFNALQAQNIYIENDQIKQTPPPVHEHSNQTAATNLERRPSPQISVQLKIVDAKSATPKSLFTEGGREAPRISDLNSQLNPRSKFAKSPINSRPSMNKTATNFNKQSKSLLHGYNSKRLKLKTLDDESLSKQDRSSPKSTQLTTTNAATRRMSPREFTPIEGILAQKPVFQHLADPPYVVVQHESAESLDQYTMTEGSPTNQGSAYLFKHYQFIMQNSKGKISPRAKTLAPSGEIRRSKVEFDDNLVSIQQVGQKDLVTSILEKYDKGDGQYKYLLIDERKQRRAAQGMPPLPNSNGGSPLIAKAPTYLQESMYAGGKSSSRSPKGALKEAVQGENKKKVEKKPSQLHQAAQKDFKPLGITGHNQQTQSTQIAKRTPEHPSDPASKHSYTRNHKEYMRQGSLAGVTEEYDKSTSQVNTVAGDVPIQANIDSAFVQSDVSLMSPVMRKSKMSPMGAGKSFHLPNNKTTTSELISQKGEVNISTQRSRKGSFAVTPIPDISVKQQLESQYKKMKQTTHFVHAVLRHTPTKNDKPMKTATPVVGVRIVNERNQRTPDSFMDSLKNGGQATLSSRKNITQSTKQRYQVRGSHLDRIQSPIKNVYVVKRDSRFKSKESKSPQASGEDQPSLAALMAGERKSPTGSGGIIQSSNERTLNLQKQNKMKKVLKEIAMSSKQGTPLQVFPAARSPRGGNIDTINSSDFRQPSLELRPEPSQAIEKIRGPAPLPNMDDHLSSFKPFDSENPLEELKRTGIMAEPKDSIMNINIQDIGKLSFSHEDHYQPKIAKPNEKDTALYQSLETFKKQSMTESSLQPNDRPMSIQLPQISQQQPVPIANNGIIKGNHEIEKTFEEHNLLTHEFTIEKQPAPVRKVKKIKKFLNEEQKERERAIRNISPPPPKPMAFDPKREQAQQLSQIVKRNIHLYPKVAATHCQSMSHNNSRKRQPARFKTVTHDRRVSHEIQMLALNQISRPFKAYELSPTEILMRREREKYEDLQRQLSELRHYNISNGISSPTNVRGQNQLDPYSVLSQNFKNYQKTLAHQQQLRLNQDSVVHMPDEFLEMGSMGTQEKNFESRAGLGNEEKAHPQDESEVSPQGNPGGPNGVIKPISRQNYRHMTSTITLDSNKSDPHNPRQKLGRPLVPPQQVSPSEVKIAKASLVSNNPSFQRNGGPSGRLQHTQRLQQIFHETHKSHGRHQRRDEFKFMVNHGNSFEAGSSSPLHSMQQSKQDAFRSPAPHGINFKSEASQAGGIQTLKRREEPSED